MGRKEKFFDFMLFIIVTNDLVLTQLEKNMKKKDDEEKDGDCQKYLPQTK